MDPIPFGRLALHLLTLSCCFFVLKYIKSKMRATSEVVELHTLQRINNLTLSRVNPSTPNREKLLKHHDLSYYVYAALALYCKALLQMPIRALYAAVETAKLKFKCTSVPVRAVGQHQTITLSQLNYREKISDVSRFRNESDHRPKQVNVLCYNSVCESSYLARHNFRVVFAACSIQYRS